tara:strand:- start:1026 stop:1724 length:699 start_codon:yes stop_codon:yes gene_type:complete
MEFFETVNTRRSVRRYTETTVPDEVVRKALDSALKAPNSSNMQAWEFYWVKSPENKSALVNACLFQGTARTANHLIVAVARIDTWKRNRDLLIQQMQANGPISGQIKDYYYKIIPFLYTQDPFGILGTLKFLILNVLGLFRPVFRRPAFKTDLFEVVTKSAALACENFMLAITAQGYGSCPMEGFDERRVKKIFKLNSKCRVVMVIGVGDIDPTGIFGPQYRIDSKLVIHEV